jgi:hypothetical protein
VDGEIIDSVEWPGEPGAHQWDWTVPELVSAHCFVEIVARDSHGNQTVAVSEEFTILLSTTDLPARPDRLALHPPRPNPFNPTTEIRFDLDRAGEIELTVYDLLGRRVRRLARGAWPAGAHAVAWDGRSDVGPRAAGGVYMIRLRYADGERREVLTGKVVMLP